MSSTTNSNEQSEWPESWKVLQRGLRKGRYIDPAFAQLEAERLWSKVWQVAARLDEIPEAGDYTTYDIIDQSVMLVRIDENTVKAYHNFCPHRGTALSEGSGNFDKGIIMCPFHGWKWDLEGCNKFVMERQEFHGGNLKDEDVALKEVKVELFAGFVFINLDKNPQPFDEFIAPVRGYIEDLAVGDMHHYWWRRIEGDCNWKVAQEAFFETFHVPCTHPQLDEVGRQTIYDDIPHDTFQHSHVKYEGFENGHGRFYAGQKPMSSDDANPKPEQLDHMIEHMEHLVAEMDAMVLQEDVDVARSLRGKEVPEGSSYGAEFIKALYGKAAAENRPMPVPKPETAAMWGGEVFIFPNMLILPNIGNVMMYRIRPKGNDPDKCIFEIYSTKTYPADAKIPRTDIMEVNDATDPEQLLLIPRQDFSNVARIQRGLHSNGCKQVWLAEHSEIIIKNMHEELDRYLGAPDAS